MEVFMQSSGEITKRLIRIISRSKYYTHTEPLLKQLPHLAIVVSPQLEMESSGHAWLDGCNFQRKWLLAPMEYVSDTLYLGFRAADENMDDTGNLHNYQRCNDKSDKHHLTSYKKWLSNISVISIKSCVMQSTPVISRLLGAKICERELSGSLAKATTRDLQDHRPTYSAVYNYQTVCWAIIEVLTFPGSLHTSTSHQRQMTTSDIRF